MSGRKTRFENLKENREKLIQFIDQIHIKVAQVLSIKTELTKEIESLKRTTNLDKESLTIEGLGLIKQIKKDFVDLNQFKNHINYKVERENLDPIEKLVKELQKWLQSCKKSILTKSVFKLADITNQVTQKDPKWSNQEFTADIIENDYFFSSKRFDVRSFQSDVVRKEIQKKLNKTAKKENKSSKFKELKFKKKEARGKPSESKTKRMLSDENKENEHENNESKSIRLDDKEEAAQSSTIQAINDSKLGTNFETSMKKSISNKQTGSPTVKVRLIQENELFNLSLFPKSLFDDFRTYVDENKKELNAILNWI